MKKNQPEKKTKQTDIREKNMMRQTEELLQPEAITDAGWSMQDKLLIALFALVFFFSTIVTSGRACLIWMLAALIFCCRKTLFQDIAEHFSIPMLGLLGLFVMTGLAGIYSPFDDSAVADTYIQLAGFTMGMVVLLRWKKIHVPKLIWCVFGILTFLGFVALDMASTEQVATAFGKLLQVLGIKFDIKNHGIVDGRLNGYFNNSNVTASLFALPLFIGLHLLRVEKKRGLRVLAAFFLGINAVVFWLCQSRGAMLSFGVALVAYLVATEKGKRIRLFLLMVICVVVTVGLSVVAEPFLGKQSVIPDVMGLICGLIIFGLDALLSDRIDRVLQGRGKLLAILGGTAVALCVVGVVVAMSVTGPYTLPDSGYVSRGVSLEPGTYTISGSWDAGINLKVVVEAEEDLLMNWGETIYDGALIEGMELTIPDDTVTIGLEFRGEPGDTLTEMRFSDGTEVKLNRTLIPELLEHRMQAKLLESASVLLRLQYMKDAVKIWAMSPIFGHGLSSTQGLYTAVQPVYYMSMYIHNHVLQYMTDMGLVGLLFFLMMMGGILWLLIKTVKKQGDPLAAMFIGAWFMMNIHGLMEISFSLRGYLVPAMVFVAVMILAYGEPIQLQGKKTLSRVLASALVLFLLADAAFLGLLFSYRTVMRKSDHYKAQDMHTFMTQIEKFITWNVYDDTYFKMVYIANGTGHSQYHAKAAKYAMQLRRLQTFTACVGVAEYYYLPMGVLDEMFECVHEGIAQKAADKAAWDIEFQFYWDTALPAISVERMPEYLEGVMGTINYLAEYEVGRYEPIVLTDENQEFVEDVRMLYNGTQSREDAYAYLMEKYCPEQFAAQQVSAE